MKTGIVLAAAFLTMTASALAQQIQIRLAQPDMYSITIKTFQLCETDNCTNGAVATLFNGQKTFDIANLQKGDVTELVPPTATIPAGSYHYLRFVLKNEVEMKGMVKDGTQYCYTAGSAITSGDANGDGFLTQHDQPFYGLVTHTSPAASLADAQAATEPVIFTLPAGPGNVSSGGTLNITTNEFVITVPIPQLTVTQNMTIGEAEETISMNFNVDEGLLSYRGSTGKCVVLLGAPIITISIGNQQLAKFIPYVF